MHVPTHRRTTLLGSLGSFSESVSGAVIFNSPTESASEGRHIVAVFAFVVFRSFGVRVAGCLCPAWSSVPSGEFEVALAVVGAEHVAADGPLLLEVEFTQQPRDNSQNLSKVESVFLLNLEHADEQAGHLVSELFLDALQLLQQGVQSDLEGLVVVDVRNILPENYLHQDQPQGKHVCLRNIKFRALAVLRKSNHLLRRKVHSFNQVLLEDLLVRPIDVLFPHYPPPVSVGDSLMPHSDLSSLDGHLADSLDDLQQIYEGLGADLLEEFEVGEEESVGDDEVVEGHGVGRIFIDALGDVELHALVLDALELSVDGAL